jgi:ribosomal protein S18 acetylase RimI-like enzyme
MAELSTRTGDFHVSGWAAGPCKLKMLRPVSGKVAVGVFPIIAIRPITPLNAFTFKAVRLSALQDDPYAFGLTYSTASQFGDSEWLVRAESLNGQRGIGFLAFDGEIACGIVRSFLDDDDSAQAHLVSMWTAPSHRRRGIGQLLVKEILAWAHERNVHTLLLTVTSNNQPAIRFYERLGFTRTGRAQPYPNDMAVLEYEMSS